MLKSAALKVFFSKMEWFQQNMKKEQLNLNSVLHGQILKYAPLNVFVWYACTAQSVMYSATFI